MAYSSGFDIHRQDRRPPWIAFLAVPMTLFLISCGGGGGGSSPTAPPAPSGVTATAGDSSASIGWSAVTSATSYNVYYAQTAGVTKATGTKVGGVVSPKLVNGLSNGTMYFFRVTALNAVGESMESNEVSAMPKLPPPLQPSGVTATAGHGEVTVEWPAVAGATSYNVYYSTTPGFDKATAPRFTGVASPCTVTPLTNGTTYYFAVAAVNDGGEGPVSDEVSATPTPAPISAPTGVTATAGPGTVTVSWSGTTGATSYNLYYSSSAGVTKATGTKVAGVSSPRVMTFAADGTTWHFVVTAENADAESVESSEVSAAPFIEYVAFGDSITHGDGDNNTADDTSADGRNTGGGFEPILNDLLTSATGIPHSIANEGYGGATSSDGLNVLPAVLATHPNATYYLILFGTNDAGDNVARSAYQANLQQMIYVIRNAGKIPYLAKVPYSLEPARNINIEEYNQAIDILVAANGIPVVPPDLYNWFQTHQNQLFDNLHPNGVGYQSMANLWLSALGP